MNTNYIVVGDSITYGIGDYENNGWTALLKKYIISKDDSKVCNNYVHIAGFPGATSTDILNKIEDILNTFKHKEFKNTVILSIGVNDTQEFNGNYKTSIEKYKENMKNIMKIIFSNECDLVVLGLTRIEAGEKFYWKPNKFYDNGVISEYDKDLSLIINYDNELLKLCANNNLKYISMKDVLDKTDYIDGLHPTAKGHKKIFDEVIKNIF